MICWRRNKKVLHIRYHVIGFNPKPSKNLEVTSKSGGTLTKQRIIRMIIAVLVVIQIPAWFFQTNPPVLAEPKWDSPATRGLAVRACFDCHSNETIWPIYARVAPIS